MSFGGEAAHVDADLGEDDLGGEVTDAGDGDEKADGFAVRPEAAVHLGVDGGGERVDLADLKAEGEAVVRARSAEPRGADRLRASPVARRHQPLGIGLAKRGAPRLVHDVGEDRGELHIDVLEGLLDALEVGSLLAYQLLSRPEQVAHGSGSGVGHEAGGSGRGRAGRRATPPRRRRSLRPGTVQ